MATSVAESPARVATSATERLMQIATGFQLSACLYVAAKLNIADLLAPSGRSVEDLACEHKHERRCLISCAARTR
jgi:hypothetical protein